MSRLAIPDDAQLPDDVRDGFRELAQQLGFLPNIVRPFALWPELFAAYRRWYAVVMGPGSALPVAVKERLALAVSTANASLPYCAAHHRRGLAVCGVDDRDPCEPRVQRLVDHAIAVTLRFAEVGDADLAALREDGWTDREILEATVVAAHFNFDNRIVLALGIVPER